MTLYAKIISLTEHHDFPSIPRKSTAQSRHLYLHGRAVLQQWYLAWSVRWVYGAHLMFSHSPISYIKQCGFSQQEALLYPRSAVQLPLPQLSSQSQQPLGKCNTLNRMALCASTQTDCVHKLPLLWACTRTGMAPKNGTKSHRGFYASKHFGCN